MHCRPQLNIMTEAEWCDEQRQAAEFLEKLEDQKAMSAAWREMAPSTEDDPKRGAYECANDEVMNWLRYEVARPQSSRIPKDAVPPRDVLRLLASMMVIERPPPAIGVFCMQIVRYLDAVSETMHLGISLTRTKDGKFINSTSALAEMLGDDNNDNFKDKPTLLVSMPWRKQLGSWPVVNWAWLVALVAKKFEIKPLGGITPNYKLKDVPVPDFESQVLRSFVDVARGHRFKDCIDCDIRALANINARVGIDYDQRNDLALLFDRKFFTVANDSGLQVEDFSARPALTFMVENTNVVVEGGSVKRHWPSVEAYVRHRLESAELHPDLSEDEAARHRDFIWEVLASQKLKQIGLATPSADTWAEYQKYAEKKLGKKLRRVARTYNMPVPNLAAEEVRLRCSHCDKPEGEAVGDDGRPGAKLLTCSCNTAGPPYYCNSECQRLDWPSHREFCTAVVEPKKKKKGGGVNAAVDSKKTNKNKKKKKKGKK